MDKTIDILFASDKLYIAHLATAIFSLLKCNPKNVFNIHIFTSDIGMIDEVKIRQVIGLSDSKLFIHILDGAVFNDLPLSNHFKKENYYRLFAANYIFSDVCLYLDSDLIVVDSLQEIFDFDLGDAYLAGVENPGFDWHIALGMKKSSRYFNSGVMLINLKKWRTTNIKDKVLNFVRNNSEAIHFVDQCGLNAVIDGEWKELPKYMNVQTSHFMSQGSHGIYNRNPEIQFALRNPKIIHFTGSTKPWALASRHPFKKLYWHYRNKTPYKAWFPDEFGVYKAINFLIRPILGFKRKYIEQ